MGTLVILKFYQVSTLHHQASTYHIKSFTQCQGTQHFSECWECFNEWLVGSVACIWMQFIICSKCKIEDLSLYHEIKNTR